VGAFEIEGGEQEANEITVAGMNDAQVVYAEGQVYSRDHNFTYSMQPNEAPRKASRVIDDKRFRKPIEKAEEDQLA
jgi:hypothetical protein